MTLLGEKGWLSWPGVTGYRCAQCEKIIVDG